MLSKLKCIILTLAIGLLSFNTVDTTSYTVPHEDNIEHYYAQDTSKHGVKLNGTVDKVKYDTLYRFRSRDSLVVKRVKYRKKHLERKTSVKNAIIVTLLVITLILTGIQIFK